MNDAIREKLKSLPEKPGCYIMRDRKGRIIYVGKAVDLKRRVSSYFRKYTMRRGDPKVRSLVNSAQDIEWIVLKSEDEALLTEDELIKRHKPRYNILLKDDKRYLGIRADARDPLPRLKACRLVRRRRGILRTIPHRRQPCPPGYRLPGAEVRPSPLPAHPPRR